MKSSFSTAPDIFKPLLKRSIFKCISWLNGSSFGGVHRSFLKEGVKTYQMAPRSPLNSPTFFFVCTSIVYALFLRYIPYMDKKRVYSQISTPKHNRSFCIFVPIVYDAITVQTLKQLRLLEFWLWSPCTYDWSLKTHSWFTFKQDDISYWPFKLFIQARGSTSSSFTSFSHSFSISP